MTTAPVSYRRDGDIAVIAIDNPPVNALSGPVRQGLAEAIATAGDDDAAAVIVSGVGRNFIAGADIREFGQPPAAPLLPDVIAALEKLDKPVIAAIAGACLGGGLETALGCHYRVAAPSARLGFPEVNLGIFPGAGGTQRSPRLIGVEKALEMITSGRPVDAKTALEIGLVDHIASAEDLLNEAISFARDIVSSAKGVRRTCDLTAKVTENDPFSAAKSRFPDAENAHFAHNRAIEAVRDGLSLPFDQAMKRERELFNQCMDSPQRAALIHVFFAERAAGKPPEAGKPRPFERVGVVGGGTMGSGIATAMLAAGLDVTMIERDDAAAEAGQKRVVANLEGALKRGKLTPERFAEIEGGAFRAVTDYQTLADSDLIIEAVFEDMAVKKAVFAQLDKVARPQAVLATNTSYLDIDEIAAVTARPQDVIGLHFFSPAHIMRLVEVVVAEKTAPDVVVTGFALAKKTGKMAVRAGVCDGFIGNRILHAYREQANYMVEDGASPYEVDAAVRAFGFPMGPFEVADLAGLDIGWAARKRRAETRDPRERDTGFQDRICERGWFGQKTGRGFYLYDENPRQGRPDPEVLAIIEAERAAKAITPRSFTPKEIITRYMAAMINEAAKVVGEGIALRPLDVDVTLIYGYGFPRWRGGPMHYADTIGLERVLADIRRHEREDAYAWTPAPLIVELVEKGAGFASLNR